MAFFYCPPCRNTFNESRDIGKSNPVCPKCQGSTTELPRNKAEREKAIVILKGEKLVKGSPS